MQKINQEAVDLIKSFESVHLEAYPDPGYGWKIPTIGYGHTGSDVYKGMEISLAEAEEYLRDDLYRFEKMVSDELSHIPLTSNQFSALVSLCFNAGKAPILKTKTIRRALERGDYLGAAEGFLLYIYSNGKKFEGLVRRRQAESALFLKPVDKEKPKSANSNNRVILVLADGVKNTYIKASTSQSSNLTDDEKELISDLDNSSWSDVMITCTMFGEEDNHYMVKLDDEVEGFPIEEWCYLYKPHWEVYRRTM